MKFKIDMIDSSSFPFGLFAWKMDPYSFFGLSTWIEISRFATRDEAKARYELLKDLPEYLN